MKTKDITLISLGTMGAIVLWFWDEIIFVAPIAAVTAILGPLASWLIMATLYFLVFFALSILTLNRFKQKRQHVLGKWLDHQLNQSKRSRYYPLIKTGTNGAVVASCFFLGGLITSNLVYRLRIWPNAGLITTALLCNVIFASVWVGFYSGIFGIIFHAVKEIL